MFKDVLKIVKNKIFTHSEEQVLFVLQACVLPVAPETVRVVPGAVRVVPVLRHRSSRAERHRMCVGGGAGVQPAPLCKCVLRP